MLVIIYIKYYFYYYIMNINLFIDKLRLKQLYSIINIINFNYTNKEKHIPHAIEYYQKLEIDIWLIPY